jgi:hypothetical protein
VKRQVARTATRNCGIADKLLEVSGLMGPTASKTVIDLAVRGTPAFQKGRQRRRKAGGVNHRDFWLR